MIKSSPTTKSNYPEPITLFLRLVLIYIFLFSVASVLHSGLVKMLVNMTAILVFVVMFVNWAFLPNRGRFNIGNGLVVGLALYYIGLIGSFSFHIHSTDYVDFLKFIMAPFFLLFGVVFEANRREITLSHSNNKYLFSLLIIIPVLMWGVQLVTGMTSYGSGQDVAFFPNRNTASLYAVILIALYNVLAEKPLKNIWVYLLVAFLFGALGVLVAVLASMVITLGNRKTWKYILLLLSLLMTLYLLFPDVGVFSRLDAVFGSIKLIYDGHVDLYLVSYGEIVRILHTTDLSFIFRLKHWLELFHVYWNGSFSEFLFGFGIGSTVAMTATKLIPHNDYLRVLLEMGIFSLIGLLTIVFLIIKTTWRRWEAIPLLAVCIYFVSENLINSYASMIIFFFSSGATLYRIKMEAH